jgi:hypothetical protein
LFATAEEKKSFKTMDLKSSSIITKYAKSIGGEESWNKIKTLIITHQIYFKGEKPSNHIFYSKSPNTSVWFENFDDYDNQWIRIGSKLWQITPYSPPIESEFPQKYYLNPLHEIRNNCINLKYEGKDPHHRDLDIILCKVDDFNENKYYFNSEGLLTKVKIISKQNIKDKPSIETHILSDYRWIEGVRLPYLKVTNFNNVNSTHKVIDIKINENIDENIFKPQSCTGHALLNK